MPDQRLPERDRDLELTAFWDALVRGEPNPEPGELDPERAALVRRLHELASAPTPAGARERARAAANAAFAASRPSSNGKEPHVIANPSAALAGPYPGVPARPVLPPAAAPASQRRPIQLYAGTALLAVIALLSLYLFYQGTNQATPPAVPGTATAAASPTSDWPMYRGNPARTGEMPGPAPSGQPAIRWTYDAGSATRLAPAVVGDTVYLPSDGGPLVALDAATGAVSWQTMSADAMPSVADGIVYMISPDRSSLVAFDAVTQEKLWAVKPGSGFWTPLVVGDTLYYGGDSKHLLIALDARTGEVRWQSAQEGTGSRSAAYADGVLVVGSGYGNVYAIDAATGATRWSYEVGLGPTIQTPAIADGRVYIGWFGGDGNAFVALDLQTGKELWRFAGENGEGFWAPAAANGTVFVPSDGGRLVALDGETGAVRWSYGATAAMKSGPAVVDDTVYAAGDDGLLLALDAATGAEQWRVPLEGGVTFGPVVSAGSIYVGTNRGTLYALGDAATSATPTAIASPAATPAPTETAADSPIRFVWARSGDAQHTLNRPGTIAIDPYGRLWVTSMPGEFFIFDLDGNLLETWGTPGKGDGQFAFTDDALFDAGSVAFAADGGFYVADAANARIQQFDRDRKFVRAWGWIGKGDGQFVLPIGIAIDRDGNVLVADSSRNDVQRFTADGQFLGKFGETGTGPGQLAGPNFLSIGPDGRIWIAEVGNHRISVFGADGTFQFTFGTGGPGQGTFAAPDQVAFDDAGNVYVCDQFNSLIQVFDQEGRFRYQFGGRGSGDGQFSEVGSIAVNRGGAVYAVDWHGNRIQKFQVVGDFPPPVAATPVS